jgi:hypothetical protein
MLPSSLRDWHNPELEPILRKTQRSPNFTPEEGQAFQSGLGCDRLAEALRAAVGRA